MASTINLLRLLADPTRLRLLLLLEQEELSVAELQEILGMGQSRISSHLAQLKRAGVVTIAAREKMFTTARTITDGIHTRERVERNYPLARPRNAGNIARSDQL